MQTMTAHEPSRVPLSLKVKGNGFLVLKDNHDRFVLSKKSILNLDHNGCLTDRYQRCLQGSVSLQKDLASSNISPKLNDEDVSSDPNTIDSLVDFDLSKDLIHLPAATSWLRPVMNLDCSAKIPEIRFDTSIKNCADVTPLSFNFATSYRIYDQKGSSHVMMLYFVKLSTNQWHMYINIDNAFLTNDKMPFDLTFTENGYEASFFKPEGTVKTTQITFKDEDISEPQDIQFDFSKLRQFANTSQLYHFEGDGHPKGYLIKIDYYPTGELMLKYHNGKERNYGQLLLATVADQRQLIPSTDESFYLNEACGKVSLFLPNTEHAGLIETSNATTSLLQQENANDTQPNYSLFEPLLIKALIQFDTKLGTIAHELKCNNMMLSCLNDHMKHAAITNARSMIGQTINCINKDGEPYSTKIVRIFINESDGIILVDEEGIPHDLYEITPSNPLDLYQSVNNIVSIAEQKTQCEDTSSEVPLKGDIAGSGLFSELRPKM